MLKNLKRIISILIFLIGFILLFGEYFKSKKIEVYDYMNELYYEKEDNIVLEEEIKDIGDKEETSDTEEYNFTSVVKEDYNYIGYLNIPKASIYKGFTSKESSNNNVNKNIQILSSSDYPDYTNGNVIIAGHSGNSSVSFFKNLYLLEINDYVYIEYNGKEYTYIIKDIYNINKTGKAEIKRNKNKSCITLITCTKNSKTTQTIYIGELVSVK